MFYNTTNQQGDTLHNSQAKAHSQKETIEHWFNNNPEAKKTPCQLHQLLIMLCLFHANTPLTSTRRAMTDLYNEGKLIKLHTVAGVYGSPAHLYALKKEYKQESIF